MKTHELQMLCLSLRLDERALAVALGAEPQTVLLWIRGNAPVPTAAAKLVDFTFGDGSPSSAMRAARHAFDQLWEEFVLSCPAEELGEIAAGRTAIRLEPEMEELFSLVTYDEHDEFLIHCGEVCGLGIDHYALVRQLVLKLGREDVAQEISDYIGDHESNPLGLVLALVVGELERAELLRLSYWRESLALTHETRNWSTVCPTAA